MLSFSVFIKFQRRRTFTPLVPSLEGSFKGPLFSFIGKAPTVSESLSPVSAVAQILPSHHTRADDEKQLLLSSSKTRPYKSTSHRDAGKSFRIPLTKTAGCHLGRQRLLHHFVAIPANLHLYFQLLPRCSSRNPFLFKFLHLWRGCTLSNDHQPPNNSIVLPIIPFVFTLLRTLLHHGRHATLFESIHCALFSSPRRVYPLTSSHASQICYSGRPKMRVNSPLQPQNATQKRKLTP
jgi:hypothetical protein